MKPSAGIVLSIATPAGQLAARDVADITRRAQSGDVDAFDLLYLAHVDRVYALCLRISADRDKARELTQDVFVRAWEKLGTFRGESLFSSWLYRLAANVIIEDQRRLARAARRLEVPLEVQHLEGATERDRDPGLGLDLERAVARLPQGARTVLVLHAVEGFRYEEIAELTGLALGTVKAQIHRARKLLKETLA